MSRPRKYDWEALVDGLFDQLATVDLDIYEIAETLDVSVPVARQVVRNLRLVLAENGDIVNVPVVRDGLRCLYHLTGDAAEVRPWFDFRLNDRLSRLITEAAVWKSIVAGTNGRTSEGRTARRILMDLNHMVESVQLELENASAA